MSEEKRADEPKKADEPRKPPHPGAAEAQAKTYGWNSVGKPRRRVDGRAKVTGQTLFADDTPVPVLDPGRGRTKTGRLWVYAREQRGWSGPDPPAAVFVYAPDRKAERPEAHLARFKGVLHVDGYAGFEKLTAKGDIVLAACWAHTRRKFYEVAEAENTPMAHEALRRIAALYAVEAEVRGQSPAHRLATRRARSKPMVERQRGEKS